MAQAFEMEASGPVYSQASGKRRRLTTKTAPVQIIPPNTIALVPEPLLPTSFARETGGQVYTVNFGPMRPKPRSLRPLQLSGYANNKPELFCISGKEKGAAYYCRSSLLDSASARAVLRASTSVQDAYKRLPLLLLPSRLVAWPEDTVADAASDIYFRGVAITDGQSEISPALARQLRILPSGADNTPCLYGVPQFRAVVYL